MQQIVAQEIVDVFAAAAQKRRSSRRSMALPMSELTVLMACPPRP